MGMALEAPRRPKMRMLSTRLAQRGQGWARLWRIAPATGDIPSNFFLEVLRVSWHFSAVKVFRERNEDL